MHAWGLRLRGVLRVLAIAHPWVLPSALMNDVGTPVAIISQLNTLPALPPVNASMAASRLATHDSGPGWLATPFPYDSFIHNSTPVYPGALIILLKRFPGAGLYTFTQRELTSVDHVGRTVDPLSIPIRSTHGMAVLCRELGRMASSANPAGGRAQSWMRGLNT
jgi:hypothetical protein